MVRRHLHVESLTRVSEVLRNQHSGLLADKESGRVSIFALVMTETYGPPICHLRVATDVVRADTQICNLESLDAVNI